MRNPFSVITDLLNKRVFGSKEERRQSTSEVTQPQRPRHVKPEIPIQRLRELVEKKDRKVRT